VLEIPAEGHARILHPAGAKPALRTAGLSTPSRQWYGRERTRLAHILELLAEDGWRHVYAREDPMTTSRPSAVAIALSIAFGFVGGATSTQRSAKDLKLSGTTTSSKRMADGKEWTTANLNVNTSSSYCYDDAEPNCRRYGRLYTWESAQRGCLRKLVE
jgi:hypothetical protein